MQTIPASFLKDLAPEQLTGNRVVNISRWVFIATLLLFAGNILYTWMDPFSTFQYMPLAYQLIQAVWGLTMLGCVLQLLRSAPSGLILAVVLGLHLCGCYVGELWLKSGCIWDRYNHETPALAAGLFAMICCFLVIVLQPRSMAFFGVQRDMRGGLLLGAGVVLILDQVFSMWVSLGACQYVPTGCF